MILWNIWTSRNQCKHDNMPMSVVGILDAIRIDVHQLYSAASKPLPTDSINEEFMCWLGIRSLIERASMHILVCWISPLVSWAKFNCDGASKGNPEHSGGGGLIRYSNGYLLLAHGYFYGIKTSVAAEERVVLDGLKLAKSKFISNLWLELDSLLIVHMLQSRCEIPWNISYIFREIKMLLPLM